MPMAYMYLLPTGSTTQTLHKAEQNYSQVEKEVLSLDFGIKTLHKYIYRRKFVLVTDHRPLMTILGP